MWHVRRLTHFHLLDGRPSGRAAFISWKNFSLTHNCVEGGRAGIGRPGERLLYMGDESERTLGRTGEKGLVEERKRWKLLEKSTRCEAFAFVSETTSIHIRFTLHLFVCVACLFAYPAQSWDSAKWSAQTKGTHTWGMKSKNSNAKKLLLAYAAHVAEAPRVMARGSTRGSIRSCWEKIKTKTVLDARKLRIQWRAKSRIHSKQIQKFKQLHLAMKQ